MRFNWHFYALALGAGAAALAAARWVPRRWRPAYHGALALGAVPVLGSLAATAYVYDKSTLYRLSWLPAGLLPQGPATLLTVQAGFDEISELLHYQYPAAQVLALDFYDPTRHTEVSIRRARAATRPWPGTLAVGTTALPLATGLAGAAVAFLSAHEIRDETERGAFLRELGRVVLPGAPVIVVEHLRDAVNFLAYTIGFLHFHTRASWLRSFQAAGLRLEQELKITPFISAFILRRYAESA
ncbi:class I SAM-dependent methyltransferase [Hymenobacter sp. RP-2-7]|uniref:Class I SAM-dependent methyltransferase n=1 Tax=Hymenobacter polaris TaxID=2682546 RepID=A0A7Y0ACV3_9BACT|nr:class I SAM-dependent methyltransferase [Hymenobacter polaris]NML64862.1 class I SAM-dependent methyltransferase [Hymenobacter polaris]